MSEKYDLDETWRLCLNMWRWIVRQIKAGNSSPVWRLKREWLDKHDIGFLTSNCFFCSYAVIAGFTRCERCPAVYIDDDFDCGYEDYDYESNPIGFLAELERLNKLRKRSK